MEYFPLLIEDRISSWIFPFQFTGISWDFMVFDATILPPAIVNQASIFVAPHVFLLLPRRFHALTLRKLLVFLSETQTRDTSGVRRSRKNSSDFGWVNISCIDWRIIVGCFRLFCCDSHIFIERAFDWFWKIDHSYSDALRSELFWWEFKSLSWIFARIASNLVPAYI